MYWKVTKDMDRHTESSVAGTQVRVQDHGGTSQVSEAGGSFPAQHQPASRTPLIPGQQEKRREVCGKKVHLEDDGKQRPA